ncbi:type VII secretion integral membrane protein EccD, partial [Streptomyces sp. SID9124]|nr:type VII secretion integral membrane protein EccD [Streptomyces sp. SID9124]
LAAAAAAVLGASGGTWGRLLALTAGLALLLRARLFRYTAQVVCLLVAGTGTLAALVTGLALAIDRAAPYSRTTALCAALVACAVLLAAAGATVPRKGLSPFWGRFLDLAESALLLSLVPLCLAVLDLYTRARALTG